MANINELFEVQTGLKAGSTTISSATGDISAAGNVTVSKTVTVGSVVIDPTTNNISTSGAITATGNITSTTGSIVLGSTVISGTAQSFGNIAVTGGSINGTPVGATTASTGKFTTVEVTGTTTVSGDILPASNNTIDIGSPTARFGNIYVNEARLSTNTLYLGDTPILGTDQNVVQIHADPGQAIHMQTSGAAGTLAFVANAQVTMQTTGNNADVLIQSNGTGAKTRILSGTQMELTAPTISAAGNVAITGNASVSSNLLVSGNLTVTGTVVNVDTVDLAVKDNIIIVNSGETGIGVTAGTAGIQFARGQVSSYQLVFRESDDTLQFGPVGSTETVATQNWVTANAGVGIGSTVPGEANRIVKADASGNISNTYFISSDASAGSGVTGIMVKAGDNYLKTGTSSAVATFLGLTTSATTANDSANTFNTLVKRDASGNFSAGVITATSTAARYADLAENYAADAEYEPGTVVCFGGEAEVTLCDVDGCARIAGVVSTDPAYVMNSDLDGLKATVALQGRVPVKVVGAVRKGDMMVAAGNGAARAEANPKMGTVIGKALENFDGDTGVIEVVVGRL